MSVPLDQPVRLTFRTFSDAAKTTAADATTVTLDILLPDGTVSTVTPTHASTGVYTYDYTPATAGHYSYHWKATGTVATSQDGSFDVRPKYDPALVSLADVKSHLNITSTADDDELQGFIDAATEVIEDITGPVLAREVTEPYDGSRDAVLLRQYPVVEVTSVTEYPTGQALAYEPVDTDPFTSYGYDLNLESGILSRISGGYPARFDSKVLVTYVAGRTVVPAAIRMAALVLVEHMWETQRGGEGPTAPFGVDETTFAAPGYLVPNRVTELLARYRKAPAVA